MELPVKEQVGDFTLYVSGLLPISTIPQKKRKKHINAHTHMHTTHIYTHPCILIIQLILFCFRIKYECTVIVTFIRFSILPALSKLLRFDHQRCISQSEEVKCIWTHWKWSHSQTHTHTHTNPCILIIQLILFCFRIKYECTVSYIYSVLHSSSALQIAAFRPSEMSFSIRRG